MQLSSKAVRVLGATGLSLALVGAGAAVAGAATSPTAKLTACSAKSGGQLRLVTSTRQCTTSERPVVWNVVGQRGATGATGATGARGAAGVGGAAGQQGEVGPQGATGQSAYEAWLAMDGNEGRSAADFLASLKGEPGVAGLDGRDGVDGVDGRDGVDGAPGVSGYHVVTATSDGRSAVAECEPGEMVLGGGAKGDRIQESAPNATATGWSVTTGGTGVTAYATCATVG